MRSSLYLEPGTTGYVKIKNRLKAIRQTDESLLQVARRVLTGSDKNLIGWTKAWLDFKRQARRKS